MIPVLLPLAQLSDWRKSLSRFAAKQKKAGLSRLLRCNDFA